MISEILNLAVKTCFEFSNRSMALLECLLLFSKRRLQRRYLGLGFLAETLNFGCRSGLRLGMERLYLGKAFPQSRYLPGGMT